MLIAHIPIKRHPVTLLGFEDDTILPDLAAGRVAHMDEGTATYRCRKDEHTPGVVDLKAEMGDIFQADKKITLSGNGFVFDLVGLGSGKKLGRKGEKNPRFCQIPHIGFLV